MKTLRIKTDVNNPTDKYINIKLEQDFDMINILSMNLSQSDVYSTFSSDTGVVCGRINSFLVGLPNAKVSLFIPVSSVENRPDVFELYPFKTVNDTDNNGKRYNLLSRIKKLNPFTYIKENVLGIGYTPKTPVGSIPDKNELLVNNTWIETYKDYYKFSTTTNDSGDFMFTNIPIGTYNLHAEFDITDIGKYSTPAPLLQKINNVSKSLYNEDGSKLLPNNDLNSMPNIYSRNVTVNVLPSWGDNTQQEIGVTRQDIDFKIKLTPAFTVIGNGFTQDEDSFWGDRVLLRVLFAISDLCFGINQDYTEEKPNLVTLKFRFKIFGKSFDFGFGNEWSKKVKVPNSALSFRVVIPDARPRFKFDIGPYYKDRVNGGQFELAPLDFKFLGFGTTKDGADEIGCCNSFPDCGANADTITDRLNLNTFRTGKIFTKLFSYQENTDLTDTCVGTTNSDYIDYLKSELITINENKFYTFNEEKGSFIHIIPCNRKRVITNELGQEVETSDSTVGVFTEFSGSMIYEMEDLPIKSTGTRIVTNRVKIKIPQSTDYDYNNELNKNLWVVNYYTFKLNEVYTVSCFNNSLQEEFVKGDNFITKAINIITKGSTATTNKYYARTGLFLPNMYDNNTLLYKDDEGDNIDTKYYFNQFNLTNINENNSPIFNDTIILGTDNLSSDTINQEWVTGSLFFQQYAIKKRRNKKKTKFPSILFSDYRLVLSNNDNIGANVTNSKGLLSGTMFPTTFVKLGLETTVNGNIITQKDILIDLYNNKDLAMNLAGNTDINTLISNNINNKFFIKGIDTESNMINNLIKKDII